MCSRTARRDSLPGGHDHPAPPAPHTGAYPVTCCIPRGPAHHSDGLGCVRHHVAVGEPDTTKGLDGEAPPVPVVSISTPEPEDSPADAETCEDLTAMGVRELIGLLAHLEDATRGWHPAASAARWTLDEVDAEQVRSRKRQVIKELRRRRARAQRLFPPRG